MKDVFDSTESWVAIVGMAGRFPCAPDLDSYWDLLVSGRDAGVDLALDAIIEAGVPAEIAGATRYVKRTFKLDGVDEFDASLFGFTPATAVVLDPQQRLFLQTVHHALEDAAIDPWSVPVRTGVFAATGTSAYLLNNLMSGDPNDSMAYGANMRAVELALSNDKDYIATRIAHTLNLTGPAMSVQTACSSSLVAVHLACQSLLIGDCDAAVAGGVSVRVPQDVGYFAEPGSIMSPTGRCRPFDAAADGTVFGSGVVAVVLKSYQTALEDGDPIRGIIRGSAINNDGNLKMGFSAPSVMQQAQVVADALAIAGVTPAEIGFIEGHGTGTPLGDPVEVQALMRAFAGSSTPCVLGSVKGNVGHLEAAAGMASLIKTVLTLQRGVIPGTCHYEAPNPELRLDGTPFMITAEPSEWSDVTRKAGVTSLGVGGTNVHLVVQSAEDPEATASAERPAMLRLSAATEEALTRSRLILADHLVRERPCLDAVATTLERRHRTHSHRCTIVARTVNDAASRLQGPVIQRMALPCAESSSLVFVYAGQGAQFPAMGMQLAQAEPDFAAPLYEALDHLSEISCRNLAHVLATATAAEINRTDLSQPLLFAVQYAWTKALETRGLVPEIVVGHDIGEFAAATTAKVMDLETAARLVCERGRLMAACPPGAMMSFRGESTTILDAALVEKADVAAINSPHDIVLAASAERLERVVDRLSSAEVTVHRLVTSHAYHSVAMEPAAAAFVDSMRAAALRAPQLPMTSNLTGGWLTAAEAIDPERWGRQIRQTVRFADDLDLVLGRGSVILVEVGPGRALTSAAKISASWDDSKHRGVLTLGPKSAPQDGDDLARCIGDLWANGRAVASDVGAGAVRAINLPGYPFERAKYWHAPQPRSGTATAPPSRTTTAAHKQEAQSLSSITDLLITRVEETLGLTGVTAQDDFFALGGDSVVAIRLAAEMTQLGWSLTPQDVLEAGSIGYLATRLSEGLIDPDTDEDGHVLVDLVPTQLRLLHEGARPWSAWRVPLLVRSQTRLGQDTVEQAIASLVRRHDILRLAIDATTLPLTGRLDTDRRVPMTFHGAGEVSDAEEILATCCAKPPADDSVVEAHLWDGESGGSLLGLALPHAFVDDASQVILLDELAKLLDGVEDLPPTTSSWVSWTRLASRLAKHPLVTQGTEQRSAGASVRRPMQRSYQRSVLPLEPNLAADLVAAQQSSRVTMKAILADALGEVLANRSSSGTVTIELEGTMRALRVKGSDLSRTVGWFTTIYPVAWHEGQGATAPPLQGFGYDAIRLAPDQAPKWPPQARVLLYYRAVDPAPVAASIEIVRSSALEAQVPPGLGHELQVEVTREDDEITAVWWYDTTVVETGEVEALQHDFVEALRERSRSNELPEELRESLADELGL